MNIPPFITPLLLSKFNEIFHRNSVVLVAAVLLLAGCKGNNSNVEPAPAPVLTALPYIDVEPLPNFLGFVEPKPGTTYATQMYEMVKDHIGVGATEPSICLSFDALPLAEPGDHFTQEEILSRLHLQVDETVITEIHALLLTHAGPIYGPIDPDTGERSLLPGGLPYRICYAVELGEELHEVTFVGEKTSGDELRYSWSFFLFDFPPSSTPLEFPPVFLADIDPGPGWARLYSHYTEPKQFYSLSVTAPSICFEVLVDQLGDDAGISYTQATREIDETIELWVDGSEIEAQPLTGNATVPVQDFCYPVNLEPGIHSAKIVFTPTGGNRVEYAWPFVLVED